MHSIAEIGTNVPAFLGKLWKMVEDPVTNDLIAWSSTGTSFVIKDEIRFARELLPMYYKHNNMASFIRQLNMYGFHKIVSPDAGSMKLETPDEIKFTHPYFMRGHPYLLDNIKRKIGVSKVVPGQPGEKNPQVINKVLSDVRQMKGRQESLDSRLTAMKMENVALWRELSVLRQKHLKQQQMVNKLIQFLVTIVHQNHGNFSVKRKYPRMLQHHDKPGKHEVSRPRSHELQENNLSDSSNSPTGPVIHELDPAEALLETVAEEAEADTSTSDIADYFLNPTDKNIDDSGINTEIPESIHVIHTNNDSDGETIIGMPEGELWSPGLSSKKKNNHHQSTTSTSRVSQMSQPVRNTLNEPEMSRPKYVRLIPKKPKKNWEPRQRPKHVIVIDPQKPVEKQLQKLLEINQNQLEINKQQLIKPEQQQSRLPKTHQMFLPKNGHVLPKHKPQLVQKMQSRGIERQQMQINSNKLPKVEPHQRLLLQRLEETAQSPPSTSQPVITIPFDNRSAENVVSAVNGENVQPLYMEGATADFSLPVVVEVPPVPLSPAQTATSPAALSPQDILINSPVVSSDPVMTPLVEPTPVAKSPAKSHQHDMQVVCVDDPSATSANLLTRSAHQCLFKIDQSDYSRSEMDSHVDSVQNDLDSLKELLHSEGISLDANTLLGYFNDDPLFYNMSEPNNGEDPKESSGNELMACTPSFDFSDLIGNDWSLPSPGDLAAAGITDDSLNEVNTPQFVPQSPSFPAPSKKRKK